MKNTKQNTIAYTQSQLFELVNDTSLAKNLLQKAENTARLLILSLLIFKILQTKALDMKKGAVLMKYHLLNIFSS